MIISDKHGSILLVRHTFGSQRWMLPGGGIKTKETPQQAVIREIYEELGICLEEDQDMVQLNTRAVVYGVHGIRFRMIVFKSELPESLVSRIAINASEIRDIRWFKKGSPEIRQAIPKKIYTNIV